MEYPISDLVAAIRKEGVDAAHQQAEQILADAHKQADAIVADANARAKAAEEASAREIGIMKEGAAASAEQAKRDAMLSFKAEVQAEYEKILSRKVRESLSGEALGRLIQAAVAGEDVASYTAEMAEVSDDLTAALAQEIRGGLTIKPVKGISAGFRLAAKDGSGYLDCSDEEILQMLMPYFRNANF